jgi:hypothetical protein
MKWLIRLCAVAMLVGLSPTSAFASSVVFSASGDSPAAILSAVDAYRSALGTLNANVAGSFGSGRREINWDGVPNAAAAPNPLPADFFNVTSPRGVVFSTPGTGFQVSASSGDVEFNNLNPGYSTSFQTFSSPRLFTALGSSTTDVSFFVPGSTAPAFTSGFGVVFTDVDLTGTTGLQLFDLQNNLLAAAFAPAANNGLSFLGVVFNAGERVGRVRITSGNGALGPSDGVIDAVAMDDFIYGEPTAVPEPSSLVLLAIGGSLIFGRRFSDVACNRMSRYCNVPKRNS